eukprot:TRINITY_DN15668_c0_g2_i1.p2 TRINITY_DN15668_c0_g2~~TRINITY_DN15668_c0_g2_i1.p2  ORF type:complete len:155 (+),score=22.54 TRINITY_DN15668_c0_g2_i1:68-532(+)
MSLMWSVNPVVGEGKKSDEEVVHDMELASQERGLVWQRCPRCGVVVFLNHGCNHVSCLCGMQFCFVCAVSWKACTCPTWTLENIVYEKEHTVNARQRAAVERLARDDVECHHAWGFVRERAVCSYCYWHTHFFHFECTQCGRRSCRNCALHRNN